MSAIEGRAKLVQAGKKLMTDWQQTRENWRDENARRFEQQYMAPLEASIRSAVLAIERIGSAIEGARQDCKDSSGLGL
jgi:hypothetical protein